MQEYINKSLQGSIGRGELSASAEYTYCIERNPDQYRKYWIMDIIDSADDIVLSLVYWDEADAQHDVELLEEFINIKKC